jgi:imidazole glycerol-phosphate synthase subunit HisF
VDDMRGLLSAGADKVAVNTSALTNPDLISQGADKFGTQCVVVAIDARQVEGEQQWDVYTHGGRTPTGIDAIEWAAEAERRGAGEILLTSMNRDGTGLGYDIALLVAISNAVNIPVIASGGAGTFEHFLDALRPGRADAVLAATLFHFGTMRIAEVKQYLHVHGVPVRLDERS